MSTEEEEKLNKEIEVLEKETTDLETQVADKKKAIEAENPEQLRKEHKEGNDKNAELKKAQKDHESKKNELQPSYERALANKDQRERADELKKEIDATEQKLEQSHDKQSMKEAQLKKFSTVFYDERDALEKFRNEGSKQTESLLGATTQKIRLTLPIDDETSTNHVNICDKIELATLLVREREADIQNASKIKRELEAILEMKKEMKAKLGNDVADTVAKRRREKDEAIKELIYSFQDQRNVLQADIDEIRKVNQEQSLNLQRGHIEKKQDPQSFHRPEDGMGLSPHRHAVAPRSGTSRSMIVPDEHARRTSFRKQPEDTQDILFIKSKNKELTEESVALRKQLQQSHTAKIEAEKNLKTVDQRMSRERKNHEAIMNKVEGKILAERQAIKELEKNNSRLTEAIQHLGLSLKTTRTSLQQLRGQAKPLPIEDS